MKMKISPRQTQRMRTKMRFLVAAGATIIIGLVIGFIVIFNFTDIRSAFASSNTYYSRATGNWENASTWSTSGYGGAAASSYPVDGDIVYIKGYSIKVTNQNAAASKIILEPSNTANTELTVDNGRTLTTGSDFVFSGSGGNKPINFTVSGTASNCIVNGNISGVSSSGSGTMGINLYNTSMLKVLGSLTLESDGGTRNLQLSVYDQAVLKVTGDINLTYTTGGGSVNTALSSGSSVSTNGDVVFNSSKTNKTLINMYNTSILDVGGSIIRSDTYGLYGKVTSVDSSQVVFTGTSPQTLTGNTTTGGDTSSIQVLTINNTSTSVPQVTVTGNIKVTSQLNLIEGIVGTSNNNMLILTDNAIATGGSDASYVQGPIQKQGSTAFIFPVGKGGRYAPIGISAPSARASFTAEYFKNAYSNTSSLAAGLTNVSTIEYWSLVQNNGTATTAATLYWQDSHFSGISSPSTMKVAYFDATSNTWKSLGSASYTGTNSPNGSITSSATTNPGFITFGSNGGNPLPVKLIAFNARAQSGKVELNWKTASEENNAFFTVERSINGQEFEAIGKINGAGNSQNLREYAYTDENPLQGRSYYRLRQTDFDGKFELSSIKTVSTEQLTIESVYPNPFQNELQVRFNMPYETEVSLQLVNTGGEVLAEEKRIASRGMNEFHYESQQNLSPGIYFMRVVGDGQLTTAKLIKQP